MVVSAWKVDVDVVRLSLPKNYYETDKMASCKSKTDAIGGGVRISPVDLRPEVAYRRRRAALEHQARDARRGPPDRGAQTGRHA